MNKVSVQAKILNKILKNTVNPILSYWIKQYLKTHDMKIIYRLRKYMNAIPNIYEPFLNMRYCVIKDVPVLQIYPSYSVASPCRTIIYLHGGAYIAGSSRMYAGLAHRLAIACKAKILLIDYRLAPEHPFPAALEDVIKVYQSVCHEESASNLVIGGDSAGGGLTLAAAVALRDKNITLPSALFCFSPWVDLACTGRSIEKNKYSDSLLSGPILQLYAHEADVFNPYASPLYANLTGLPPLLIAASSSERLLDDAKRFVVKAKKSGVSAELEIYNNMPHVWPFFASFLPEGRAAICRIGEFVRKKTS